MGKVKVRTLGTEEEEVQKKERKKKKEEKKKVHLPGMKGGQRVIAVGPSEEELARLSPEENKKTATTEPQKKLQHGRKKHRKKHARSKKYQDKLSLIDKNKKYSVSEGLEILKKMPSGSFDETVELHLNSKDPKVSVNTSLPHGVGKSLRVAIASDALVGEIEKGKINFDILLAEASMMPKLAKVAKILGPKGLMPNPKNGTITSDPEKEAKKYEGGLTFIKTESKAPIIHIAVGKVSLGVKKLEENIDAVLNAVKKENIEKAVLKSTMSPGIKISV